MEEQKIQMWELDGHIKKVNLKSRRDEAETPELCAIERGTDRVVLYDRCFLIMMDSAHRHSDDKFPSENKDNICRVREP